MGVHGHTSYNIINGPYTFDPWGVPVLARLRKVGTVPVRTQVNVSRDAPLSNTYLSYDAETVDEGVWIRRGQEYANRLV